ncbi:MAG: alpha/beta fold hydrolase [bacterium]|nr:alpha/beta fold hydrolase [bacterium]
MKPVTKYTKSGRINIAYQVFGSGPVDLVYVPGWVSNIDWMWQCPELVHFLKEMGKIARVILFDKRGTGLSDRLSELSTLEERMDDIRAVMDAVGSQKAVLFGHSEGGCASALFAATYPNRVTSLIMFGSFAKRKYSPEYPWAPTDEERQEVYDMIETSWGEPAMGLENLAPSKADDKTFLEWLANYFRSGASPSAAMVLTKMNTEVDIINILGSIRVPTMILQRKNDIDVKIEEGRFLASHIPNAKLVEMDGDDHLFWVGNTNEVLGHMQGFILEERTAHKPDKQLLTIVAARILSDATVYPECEEFILNLVKQYNGKHVYYNQEMLITSFEGPSKAVHFSLDLLHIAKNKGINVAIGIDMKEVDLHEAQFISDRTERYVNSLLQEIQANQIFITYTVKYLLSGTGLTFEEKSTIFDMITGDPIPLFGVLDPDHLDAGEKDVNETSQKDTFLEMVLNCINKHLTNESFNVSTLCRSIGTSERQLQRKLKLTTNKTPNQLISSVRMYKAKELLRLQKYNIAEVAYQVGFTSPSYFTKKFKEEFGTSPSHI